MKKYVRSLGGLVVLALLAFPAFSQPYTAGIGARAGLYLGLTAKVNLDDHSALELIGETRRKGVLATVLYEYHFTFDRVDDGLRLYLGGGGHASYLSSSYINTVAGGFTRQEGFGVGLDAIVGLEYTFPSIPINLSVDYKPAFFFWDRLRVSKDNIALSVRYVFQ